MDLAELEKLLGYEFRDKKLLEQALTHRSWANERMAEGSDASNRNVQNEALEFVGDSVVGLVFAELLYRRHPRSDEGGLTLMKHRLVSTPSLAEAAARIKLGSAVRLGRGEHLSGGRTKPGILADTLEAVIAAIFFDGGYEAARETISRVFEIELEKATPKDSTDYKTMLQECLQAAKLSAPKYSLVRSEGLPHSRTFVVEAAWEGGRTIGIGRSIKSAEMMAASEALRLIATERSEP